MENLQVLAIFPKLLSYPLLAYMLLRLVLVYQFSKIAWNRKNKKYSFIIFLEFIPAFLVFIGLFTQVALLFIIAFIILEKFLDKKEGLITTDTDLKITLIIISIALLFLGPGSFAIDLPL